MSKKILVAEDSSVIQNLTKKILSGQNYAVTTVKNGKEVMDAVKKEPFDLVLMDIYMPILDGLACAREIRASDNPLVKDMPIIAITGNAFNYSIEDFHNAGINDYLPKPLNYDHMVELVKKYLEK
jgi:two-component system, cell cycle response regulator DivK